MVRASYEQKPYRRIAIETWGGEVVPSPVDEPDHPGSLGSAISDAVRDCVGRDDTHYSLGSVLNHVLLHQTVIGIEAKEQLELAGERLPDVVIASCGGGSNLGGIAFPFVPDADVRLLAVEPLSCPTLTQGRFDYDFGDTAGLTPLLPMYTLGHDFIPPSIHAGGLRYHGDSPLISQLVRDGRMEAVAYPQGKVFDAAVQFARTEGKIPAPECAHSIRGGRRRGARRQGDRRGEGHPLQLQRSRLPGSRRLRRLQQRPPARGAGLRIRYRRFSCRRKHMRQDVPGGVGDRPHEPDVVPVGVDRVGPVQVEPAQHGLQLCAPRRDQPFVEQAADDVDDVGVLVVDRSLEGERGPEVRRLPLLAGCDERREGIVGVVEQARRSGEDDVAERAVEAVVDDGGRIDGPAGGFQDVERGDGQRW